MSAISLMNATTYLPSCVSDNSCYIVNATTWLGPLSHIQPLYGVLIPILTAITMTFNTIIIIVLSRYIAQNK